MEIVNIYTCGVCNQNPGIGGWSAIILNKDNKKEILGSNQQTTNNRMELTAVIEALKILELPCEVKLYSNSGYVVDCFKKDWIHKWINNNWRKSSTRPIKNRELWEELYELMQKHKVEFIKINGRSYNELSKRCYQLAYEQQMDSNKHKSN